MSMVGIAECRSYEEHRVSQAVKEALSPLGGMSSFVSEGQRVLLKVNLLAKAEPDKAVTTHPEVVRALIRSVRAAGGIPAVGDSPGGPNTAGFVSGVQKASGMAQLCEEERVELLDLAAECTRVANPEGSLFGAFTIAQPVVDCDVLISVPKFKTHGFMMFTGAVKNLFGCIPGLEKATYHLRVPDRDDFGSMLVDLMLACRPALAVMDAVVGMEGDGPSRGTPREVGAIIASADSVALDVVASAIAGFETLEVYTNRAAAARGIGPHSVDEVEVVGVDWRELAPPGFELPPRDLGVRVPPWLAPRIRSWIVPRPFLDVPKACTSCRKCEQSCPVIAIEVDRSGPHFNYDKCIRCYCCEEMCPEHAIGLRTPPFARLFTRRAAR